MKTVASWLWWPGFLAAAVAVNAYGMTTTMPLIWLNISYFGLAAAIWLLERLMPHEQSWVASDGQFFADIGHTLLSKSAVQILIVAPAIAGVSGSVDLSGGPWWPQSWPMALQVVLGLVIAEFGLYWAHRLSHEWPTFWRFHAVHHSVTKLWFVNTGRRHFIDTIISVSFGLGAGLMAGAPEPIIIWVSAITAYIGLLTHANIEGHFGLLSLVFNTSTLHRWHHSKIVEEGNMNYGENLVLWDMVFGTFFNPARRPPADIGINDPMPASLYGQIMHPFRRSRDVTGPTVAPPPDGLAA